MLLTTRRSFTQVVQMESLLQPKAGAKIETVAPIDDYSVGAGKHQKYRRGQGEDPTGRAMSYAVLGAAKGTYALGGRMIALTFLDQMSPSADVLALASMEVDLTQIPLGETVKVKWRGKPVFVSHRNESQIAQSRQDDSETMRDMAVPFLDSDRAPRPEWMVVLGICTHLGCIPIGGAGDWGGYFCPCHGSHYDVAGRIRKGPAPLNLEIPPYEFVTDTLLKIG